MYPRRFITKASLMGAALFASVMLAIPSATAAPPVKSYDDPSAGDFDMIIEGIPVHVDYIMKSTTILYFDNSGAFVRAFQHIVEQDTFTGPNGNPLVSEPYTFNFEFKFDSAGNLHTYVSGVLTRVPLPDGTVFTSAGRVDWFDHPDTGYLLFADHGGCSNLEGFIAALSL